MIQTESSISTEQRRRVNLLDGLLHPNLRSFTPDSLRTDQHHLRIGGDVAYGHLERKSASEALGEWIESFVVESAMGANHDYGVSRTSIKR